MLAMHNYGSGGFDHDMGRDCVKLGAQHKINIVN